MYGRRFRGRRRSRRYHGRVSRRANARSFSRHTRTHRLNNATQSRGGFQF